MNELSQIGTNPSVRNKAKALKQDSPLRRQFRLRPVNSRRPIHIFTVLLVFVTLFASSSLLFYTSVYNPATGSITAIRFTGIGVSVLVIVFIGFARRYSFRAPTPLLITWGSFALCSAISSALNGSLLKEAPELIWLMISAPLIYFFATVSIIRSVGFGVIMLAAGIAHLGLILYSVAYDPNLTFRYKGMFGDPNQLGMVTLTTVLPVIVALVLLLSEKKLRLVRMLLVVVTLMAATVLIIISSHRTSLGALLVTIAVASFARWKSLHKGRLLMMAAILVLFVWIGSSMSGLAAIAGDAFFSLSAKNQAAFASGLVLDGREDLWAAAAAEPALFGHGRQYLEDITGGFGAHNAFLHIWATRGVVATALLGVLCLQSFFYAWQNTRRRSASHFDALGPLVIVTAFWCLGLTEGSFGSLGTGIEALFLCALGWSSAVYHTTPKSPKAKTPERARQITWKAA